jgi:hypothetical protein
MVVVVMLAHVARACSAGICEVRARKVSRDPSRSSNSSMSSSARGGGHGRGLARCQQRCDRRLGALRALLSEALKLGALGRSVAKDEFLDARTQPLFLASLVLCKAPDSLVVTYVCLCRASHAKRLRLRAHLRSRSTKAVPECVVARSRKQRRIPRAVGN